MGTHMDGLNHLQVGERTYNGHRIADIAEEWGTNQPRHRDAAAGRDPRPAASTSPAVRGVDRLEPGDVVTPDDVEAALAAAAACTCGPATRCCSTPAGARSGASTTSAYGAGEPGPGLALAEWLADHRVALTGCDTWSYGPVPAEDPAEPFVVPQTLNTHHGVVVVENLRLAELARAGLTEFLLVISHAKLRGATGAWVAPLAIV